MTSKAKPENISSKRSVYFVGSKQIEAVEGAEETEVAAQIFVPEEGGWGWVVVGAAFMNIFLLDGISFSFGSLITDISQDLKASDSIVALVNSVQVALYCVISPIATALINKMGFRETAMIGSVLCSFSLFISYFSMNYASLFFFYGVINGIGCCLINMSSCLVPGFYFEKLRSLAFAIALTGSGAGLMIIFPLNVYLVKLSGWRSTTLFHSGCLGLVFFLSMTFRPVVSVTITMGEEDVTTNPTRTVTYLPSVAATKKTGASTTEGLDSTNTERFFGAVSNIRFPTAADLFRDTVTTAVTTVDSSQAGTSAAPASRLVVTSRRILSQRQVNQVKSIMSKMGPQDNTKPRVSVTVNLQERPKKQGFFARLCSWKPHTPEARPMYRDDVFYDGKMKNLPTYQKSMAAVPEEERTGLEYQLAVTRAVAVEDLQDTRGFCTAAVRRVFASMVDCKLFKRPSFLAFCFSTFFLGVGGYVPFVFLKDRNQIAGVHPDHCGLFVSVIGLSNTIGRLVLGMIASKVDPLLLYIVFSIIGGVSTALSDLSYSLAYQYGYCLLFGWCMAASTSLRTVIIVSLYGLDKLTSAMGMMFLFVGLGNVISTPLAGILKNSLGFSVAFIVSGVCLALCGIICIPTRTLGKREDAKAGKLSNGTNETKDKNDSKETNKANEANKAKEANTGNETNTVKEVNIVTEKNKTPEAITLQ